MPDVITVLAAVLFFAANALLIVFFAKERERAHFDRDKFYDLDVDYLRDEWEFRIDNNPMWLAAGFLNCFAWLFFSVPIIQMTWVLSQRGSSKLWIHVTIAISVLAGSFTEWISRLCWIGSNVANRLLVRRFDLDVWFTVADGGDGMGWKSMEVSHIVSSGYIWIIDSFEWICLSVILILTYVSVRMWREHDASSFGGCWNSLGLFIGLMCVLEFTAEVLRFDGFRTFGPIAIIYAILNRLVLIPIWLFCLSFMLPRAIAKANAMNDVHDTNAPELELSLTVNTNSNRNNANGAAGLAPLSTGVEAPMNAPPPNLPNTPPASAFGQAPLGSPMGSMRSTSDASSFSELPPPPQESTGDVAAPASTSAPAIIPSATSSSEIPAEGHELS